MTKPVQIQTTAWMYTPPSKDMEPLSSLHFNRAEVLKNAGWTETPLIAVDAARSLLEAKAKEWKDEAQREYDSAMELGRMGSKESAMRINARSRTRAHLSDELLSLAATLGNQGK